MEYPKPVMSTGEIINMKVGLSKEWLRAAYNSYANRNKKIAWKNSPKSNSKIWFDTAELEKYRKLHRM